VLIGGDINCEMDVSKFWIQLMQINRFDISHAAKPGNPLNKNQLSVAGHTLVLYSFPKDGSWSIGAARDGKW